MNQAAAKAGARRVRANPGRPGQKVKKSRGPAGPVFTTVRKSGGARIITLPAAFLAQTQWDEGQELELTIADGEVVVRPRKQLTLDELMAQVPEGGLPSLEQIQGWDQPSEPAGSEVMP